MKSYNVKKYNVKNLLLLLIISGLLITNVNFGNIIGSSLATGSRSTLTLPAESADFELVDISLGLSPQTVKPPSVIELAAAERAKVVFDEKTEKTIFDGAAVTGFKMPAADGKVTFNNEYVDIDASNTAQGYVMLKFKATDKSLQRAVRITNAATKLNYEYILLTLNEYVTFPLTDGNGQYTISAFEQVGSKFAMKNTATFDVKVTAENNGQFLYPSYYVNYNKDSKAVKMAKHLCTGVTTELGKVEKVYNYVIDNIKYDYKMAEYVQTHTGYLPDLNKVMTDKIGICFDYASLMTAMLRSQNVATKMVFGFTSGVYHAWINVFIKDVGWVDGVIQFDGKTWKLMDPTFAASSSADSGILEYIGDGKNYTVRFTY